MLVHLRQNNLRKSHKHLLITCMKGLIPKLLLALLCGLPALAWAQAPADANLIQKADVLRTYRRVKLDMEEKARNVKGMRGVKEADVEAFEAQYSKLRKDFNQFVQGFGAEVRHANGAPLNLCELSRGQLYDFMKLYHAYEEQFLVRYEEIIGTRERPLIEAGFADNVMACNPRSAIVDVTTYRNQYEPELTVATWSRL